MTILNWFDSAGFNQVFDFKKNAVDINFPEMPPKPNYGPGNDLPNPNVPLPPDLVVKMYDLVDGRPWDVLEDLPTLFDQGLRFPFVYREETGGVANHPLTEPQIITYLYQQDILGF